MYNLYSITTNQAVIVALFRVMNRCVGNLAPMPAINRGINSRFDPSSSQDNSNSKRACFFDLAGETAIFTLSPSAVRKPNNRSNE